MEQENYRSPEQTRRLNIVLYVFWVLAILVPLVLSLICRNSSYESSSILSEIRYAFGESDFFLSGQYDYTSMAMAAVDTGDKVGLLLLQSVFCLIVEIALLHNLQNRKRHFVPFAVCCSALSLAILFSMWGDILLSGGDRSWYSKAMLWGRYVRALRGPLPVMIYAAAAIALVYYMVNELREQRRLA